MKRSDINDDHVIELARAYWLDPDNAPGVIDALIAEGVPEKLAVSKVEQMSDRGILDYGTSPYYAWPDPRVLLSKVLGGGDRRTPPV